MTDDELTRDLLTRAAEGDQHAKTEIVQRYWSKLITIAARRLGSKIQSQADPDDIAQSVFRTFFRRNDLGKFSTEVFTIHNSDGLAALLSTIAIRKCFRLANSPSSRAVGSSPASDLDASFDVISTAVSKEPTAEDGAMLNELLEQLMSGLTKPEHRKIIELRVLGFDVRTIAKHSDVKYSERMVAVVISKAKELLRGLDESR